MNESEMRGSVAEAVIVLVVVFIVLAFFMYKFGTNQNTVTNPIAQVEESTIFQNTEETDLYNKYVKQIYDAQASGTVDVSPIIEDYQTELSAKVTLPVQFFEAIIDNSVTKTKYANDFESIFAVLKQRGGTTESSIFKAQIGPDNTLLPLSDFDHESLERIATVYEEFAKSLKSLPTTAVNEKYVEEIGRNSLNIAYILRQMNNETDEKIYTLWISKYMENMSAIITDRYAISGKN